MRPEAGDDVHDPLGDACFRDEFTKADAPRERRLLRGLIPRAAPSHSNGKSSAMRTRAISVRLIQQNVGAKGSKKRLARRVRHEALNACPKRQGAHSSLA
jgi:hypothetical protein